MEAQYNVVGENVFLHRMETNTRFVTGAAFAGTTFTIKKKEKKYNNVT